MATLLWMKELTLIRGGSAEYADDGRSYQRSYRFVFAAPLGGGDDFDAVAAWAGTPAIGDPLKSGDPRLLKRISIAAMDQTGCEFLRTDSYEIPSSELTYNENPLDRPDELSGGGANAYTQPYYEDFTTPTPLVSRTAAGEPLNPLPTRTGSGLAIRITGNRSTLPLSTWAAYLQPHATNNASVTVRGITIGTGEAKLVDISFSREIENQYAFWRVTWAADLAETWEKVVEHRGFYYKDGTEAKPILTGEPLEQTTVPWPLDGAGDKKATMFAPPYSEMHKPQPPRDFSIFGWTSAA